MKKILKQIVFKILEWEASFVLWRHEPEIIAITGSVGKTTTKDMIYDVMRTTHDTRKNPKSYNSEIGVPITILELPNAWSSLFGWINNLLRGAWYAVSVSKFPKYLVLEVGADHPGDIKRTCAWLHPDMGVVTGLGSEVPVHVEFFPTIEALVREKAELLISLRKDGLAILNRDDDRAWSMRGLTKAHVFSFGFDKESNVHGSNAKILYEGGRAVGMTMRVDYAGKTVPVRIMGALGMGQCYAALAAIAVGVRNEINLIEIAEAIASHEPTPGRMRVLRGIKNSTIIDDTYNSSPAAVKVALNVLHEIDLGVGHLSGEEGRKIAVLGDMMELGQYEELEHRKVGEWLRGVANVIVCVGKRAKWIGESALKDGCEKTQVMFFEESSEAGRFLKDVIKEGDTVLLKASQSVRLERATEMLLEDESKAESLLVRQDRDWKRKK